MCRKSRRPLKRVFLDAVTLIILSTKEWAIVIIKNIMLKFVSSGFKQDKFLTAMYISLMIFGWHYEPKEALNKRKIDLKSDLKHSEDCNNIITNKFVKIWF